MPSNLSAATVSPASTVLPYGLQTAFTETQQFPLLSNLYVDGTVQRSLIVDGVNPARPARTWHLSRRLTTAQLTTLLAFWETVQGGYLPFYFYDPFQGVPIGSNWDATGATTTGRIVVVFRGNWLQGTELGRHVVADLNLVEVT